MNYLVLSSKQQLSVVSLVALASLVSPQAGNAMQPPLDNGEERIETRPTPIPSIVKDALAQEEEYLAEAIAIASQDYRLAVQENYMLDVQEDANASLEAYVVLPNRCLPTCKMLQRTTLLPLINSLECMRWKVSNCAYTISLQL